MLTSRYCSISHIFTLYTMDNISPSNVAIELHGLTKNATLSMMMQEPGRKLLMFDTKM